MKVINEGGDTKCIDAKGNIKWMPQSVVTNDRIMKDNGLVIFEAPEIPCVKSEKTEVETIVAEVPPAKRGRKINTK